MKIYLIFFLLLYFQIALSENRVDKDHPFFGGEYGGILGEEFWVYDDAKSGNPYSRNEVIWSYEEAPDVSRNCGLKAHHNLKTWLKDPNSRVYKSVKTLRNNNIPTTFFVWTDDYRTNLAVNKESKNGQSSKLWLYEKSLIKFVSSVNSQGICEIPSEEKTLRELEKIAIKFEEDRRKDMNFIIRIFDKDRAPKMKKEFESIKGSNNLERTGSRER